MLCLLLVVVGGVKSVLLVAGEEHCSCVGLGLQSRSVIMYFMLAII